MDFSDIKYAICEAKREVTAGKKPLKHIKWSKTQELQAKQSHGLVTIQSTQIIGNNIEILHNTLLHQRIITM